MNACNDDEGKEGGRGETSSFKLAAFIRPRIFVKFGRIGDGVPASTNIFPTAGRNRRGNGARRGNEIKGEGVVKWRGKTTNRKGKWK